MSAATAEPATKGRFSWLRPPKGGPGGTMALADHLRELRYRLFVIVGAMLIGAIVAGFFYRQLVEFILAPWERAKGILEAERGAETMIVNMGVTQAFTVAIVVCLLAGFIGTAPVWMWQVWAFVAPGLLAKEKKYALGFVGASLPLFLAGCALGYIVWPKGIEVLLSFTPQDMDITNLLDMWNFLGMEIKIILVFGISFLLPVLMVGLNMGGVVRGYHLKKARKGVVFGSVVFAAIATPTTDPFSMLALAVPLSTMFFIAEIICRILDKRRGITEETVAEYAIDLDDGK